VSDWEKLGLPAPRAQLLRIRYENRLPSALENLTGPTHGIVQLPLHIAWPGRTAFDIDQPNNA
jgi:hypothetical protein